jgi:hypothetical protein
MSKKIQAKEFYLEKLKEDVGPNLRLAEANLKLLAEREKGLGDQMAEIQNSKREWMDEKKEAEEKSQNPLPSMKRRLERDFLAEVSQRKGGGDPEMNQRLGGPQFGVRFQNRNRRTVLIPRLQRDGERKFYQNVEVEIEDRRDNEEAFRDWEAYMSSGLASEIPASWDFDKLFEEIEKFFSNAPSIEKYGTARTVYVETGETYSEQGVLKPLLSLPQAEAELTVRFDEASRLFKSILPK